MLIWIVKTDSSVKRKKAIKNDKSLQIIYASSLKFSKFLGEKEKESFIIYFYVHIQK